MEDNYPLPPEEPASHVSYRPAEPQVPMVLLGQLAASLGFAMAGAALYQLIHQSAGWDAAVLTGVLAEDAPPEQRWPMRLLLVISQLSAFLLAGWATVRFFYGPPRAALAYLQARRWPAGRTVALGALMILLAVPLVLYTYNLNQALPLPDTWRTQEADAETTIKALLQMDTVWELLANLILIAVLPALGEELVFRGVVQQQLLRRMQPGLAILLSAAIFSFVHFQFEGFLPRMLLGVLLGWLYWNFQNIWVPVAAHFVNNAVQVLGQYLYSRELSTVDLEQDVDVPWMAAAVSGLAVFALLRWGEGMRAVSPKT